MSRRGMSLVELLVVIAIITVLLGLLIPAVMRVRDASLCAVCSNKLRQVGLAHHQYHTQHSSLPPGMRTEASDDPHPYLTWQARLLPFLEQEALWQQIVEAFKTERNFLSPDHPKIGKQYLGVFICPSDPREDRRNGGVMGLTSYQGVAGRDGTSRDGCLFADSAVKFADITDGLSHTLLVGERPASPDLKYGWWYAGWGQNKDGIGDCVLGVNELRNGKWDTDCPPGPYSYRPPANYQDNCAAYHYWSFHIGGGQFLLADGSVHFLAYTAAPRLAALASRAGGESESVP